jgi:hypothetical protein
MPLLLSQYQFPDLRKVDFHFYHVQADKRKGGLKVLNSTAPKLQVLRLSLGKTYAFSKHFCVQNLGKRSSSCIWAFSAPVKVS